MKSRSFLKLLLLTGVGFSSLATLGLHASEAKTVKLLTIGNSFSRNATNYLDDLVENSKHKLKHNAIVVGGASLELHANKAAKNKLDTKDPEGLYANEKSLFQYLKEDAWDAVTIQQASIKSHDYATYQPFADQLAKIIREHAPQAQLYVHQTWAYRSDDPRFKPSQLPKPGEPKTQKEMYDGLRHAYAELAKAVNAKLLPVGDAFWAADQDPKFGYKKEESFDFKTAKRPALPDQTHSLHVGWKWSKTRTDPNKITLNMDGHHANLAGEFLGACVWYEKLFQEDVRQNSFIPEGLDHEYAAFLKQKAHEAVENLKNP